MPTFHFHQQELLCGGFVSQTSRPMCLFLRFLAAPQASATRGCNGTTIIKRPSQEVSASVKYRSEEITFMNLETVKLRKGVKKDKDHRLCDSPYMSSPESAHHYGFVKALPLSILTCRKCCLPGLQHRPPLPFPWAFTF